MNALALLLLLATAEPKLELRAPDRLTEAPPGPPVLYTGDGHERGGDGTNWNRIFVIAGGVLIAIAFYMTTRHRKPPEQEPGDE